MILALDLATQLGFCWGVGDRLPTVGHVCLPSTGNEVGPFLCAYEDWLNGMLDERKPDLVIFESPVLPRKTTVTTTRKLQGLSGVTEMLCHHRQTDCREVSIQRIKHELSGNGRASKDEMIAAARAFGLAIKVSDEADAFGVWLTAVRLKRPEHAARWQPLFMGAPA
jgi:crossover junction endodeoxyribonuclease RuvC